MTDRGTCWSLTINNPIQDDEDAIHIARQKGWKVEGQKERGEQGTEHYQLMLRTPQVRFSAVKKQFPRAHIELARNPSALATYVSKEETRLQPLAASNQMQPSQALTFDMFCEWILDQPGVDAEHASWVTWAAETWQEHWERFTHDTISEGQQIEQIAVNPQTVAIIRRYGTALMNRRQKQLVDKARQTDKDAVDLEQI